MTRPDNSKDTEWLDALSGAQGHRLSDEESQEAEAIRLAIQRRAERIDAAVPTPNQAALERIQFAVRQKKRGPILSKLASPKVWARAASIGVVAALIGQFIPRYVDLTSHTVPDVDRFATVITSTDPYAKALFIVGKLERASTSGVRRGGGGESEQRETQVGGAPDDSPQPRIRELGDGRVVVEIPASKINLQVLRDELRDELGGAELDAVQQNGVVELVIVPEEIK